MRQIIPIALLLFFLPLFSSAQTVRDDGKITKREERFVQRKLYASDRSVRLQEWKDSKKQKRLERKNKRKNRKMFKNINANKRNWGTRRSRKEHAAHNKAMKKGWFARENPRKHVKETNYP